MGYKSTNSLMMHLRNNGLDINGSKEKRQLKNTGYYHGYKGYRFYKNASNKLPFLSYREVYSTIQYDSKLKALFYDKLMYIETAVKNISLESILEETRSEDIQKFYSKVVCSYQNAPLNSKEKERRNFQQYKLNLQRQIQSTLTRAYKKNNPVVTHFYNNGLYSGVPLWALFEIITMGDFGSLLSCLTYEMRDKISKNLGLNVASDTNRELIYKYIYSLKDLRNAVAHNSVIFDGRFRQFDPSKPMKKCLEHEMHLNGITFENIEDYLILICYYLKILKVPKTEINRFIREFENIIKEYKCSVNPNVIKVVIHSSLEKKIKCLKRYIKMH